MKNLRFMHRWDKAVRKRNNYGFTLMEQILAMVLSVALFSSVAFVTSGLIRNFATLQKLTRAERVCSLITDGLRATGTDATNWIVEEADYGVNVTLETTEGSYPLAYDGNYQSFLVCDTSSGQVSSEIILGQPKLMGAISDVQQYEGYYIGIIFEHSQSNHPEVTVYCLKSNPLFFSSLDGKGQRISVTESDGIVGEMNKYCVTVNNSTIPTATIEFTY